MQVKEVLFDQLVEREMEEEIRLEEDEACPACDGNNIKYDNLNALCLDCGKEWFV